MHAIRNRVAIGPEKAPLPWSLLVILGSLLSLGVHGAKLLARASRSGSGGAHGDMSVLAHAALCATCSAALVTLFAVAPRGTFPFFVPPLAAWPLLIALDWAGYYFPKSSHMGNRIAPSRKSGRFGSSASDQGAMLGTPLLQV
jgi:hypothetical protein